MNKNLENEKHTCCICGKEFIGYGNNPWPLKEEGRCCNDCNQLVILQRLSDYGKIVTKK